MFKFNQSSDFERSRFRGVFCGARSAVTLLALLGAGVAVMGAQINSNASDTTLPVAQHAVVQATPFAASQNDALFSTSASQNADEPVNEASLVPSTPNFAEMMQYGGGQRHRYGRPRYRGSNTNADGSSKWVFFGGAGLSQPIGNTWHYLTPSYGFQVGGGRQFNKHFAVPIQFDYDHFGFAKQTLDNQSIIYFGATGQGLDGTSHVWSFTVDPTYTIASGDKWGTYLVAGVGFYHKVADFTVPATGEYCDPYYGCYQYEANQIIDDYNSNAPGFNGGFGVTYKFSRFSNERLYAEARYVFVDDSQRQGVTINNYETAPSTSTNFYPANSNRTTYIPIKFGIRF
jgi:hypothetical protein